MRWLTDTYTITANADQTNNKINAPGHTFQNGDTVILEQGNGGTLGTEFTVAKKYFVVGRDAGTFQLALAPGGAVIAFDTDGDVSSGHIVTKLTTHASSYYVSDALRLATDINGGATVLTTGSAFIDDIAKIKFVDASTVNGCDGDAHDDIQTSVHVIAAAGSALCNKPQVDGQGRKACQAADTNTGTYTSPTSVYAAFAYVNSASRSDIAATHHSEVSKTRGDNCGSAKTPCGKARAQGDVADPASTMFRLCMVSFDEREDRGSWRGLEPGRRRGGRRPCLCTVCVLSCGGARGGGGRCC
jgi:hypothetical protein